MEGQQFNLGSFIIGLGKFNNLAKYTDMETIFTSGKSIQECGNNFNDGFYNQSLQ